MTSVRVPESARKAARLMTVVVLPTPPFWFVQAVIRTTSAPLRVQMCSLHSTSFGLSRGLPTAYGARTSVRLSTRMFHVDQDIHTAFPGAGGAGPERRILDLTHAPSAASTGTCPITYLSPLLAVIVGIVHAGLAPVIVVGGVKPNLVLVGVVLVTC